MQPKPEYPRMQFRRTQSWINLNGEWSFAFDYNRSAISSGDWKNDSFFDKKIIVPFAPESKLSGIADIDYHESVFYRKDLKIPEDWNGKRILLHFGAVDYHAHIYIDDQQVFNHSGGSSHFEVDLTDYVIAGHTHTLKVHAEDFGRSGKQGLGKQSYFYESKYCSYTRTTGIWQTVWLEAVPVSGLKKCKILTDIDNGTVTFIPAYYSTPINKQLEITIKGNETITQTIECSHSGSITIQLNNPRLWSTIAPYLYDVELRMTDDKGAEYDYVESYFGMRKFDIRGNRFYLNNKPIYLRWVLDQGYYPEGVWTSPNDEALRHDIELSMAVGFNGARLHQKVFEERFHYWADKLGYITSAEYPSFELKWKFPDARFNFMNEWRDCIERDFSHPSIVMWTPFNESATIGDEACDATNFNWGKFAPLYENFISQVGALTKALDPTRPWHDSSGYVHVGSPEIYSVHYYEPSAEDLMEKIHPDKKDSKNLGTQISRYCHCQYNGAPYFVDEWGGFKYVPKGIKVEVPGWGYNGINITSPEEFAKYISEQAEAMRIDDAIAGHCYTQLTDIEQEQNGIYTYRREEKAPIKMLRDIIGKKPEWSDF